MKYFGMITTARSDRYTPHALASFFQQTKLEEQDRFFLIDNDRTFPRDVLAPFPKVELIANSSPRSFAENVNEVMRRASEDAADLYFLNNDLIFTKDWIIPLDAKTPSILSPLSNREAQYIKDGLRCDRTCELEDFLGKEKELEVIRTFHSRSHSGYQSVLTLPFFCVKLPYEIYSVVGELDESFGRGGAEDNDYCVRTILAGFHIRYASSSYVLHFNGKSTWAGGETEEETTARCEKYEAVFREKWGEKLLRLLITFDNTVLTEAPEVLAAANAGEFRKVMELLGKG